jgi:transcriptional regulator with XRE-family HTH domain
MSESHLSEVRRGLKAPTLRVLEPLAWFFEVPVDYFLNAETAAAVEGELAVREAQAHAQLKADREAREDLAAAARELQRAIRESGVTRLAHRANSGTDHRQQAAMMRALARVIRQDYADEHDDLVGPTDSP